MFSGGPSVRTCVCPSVPCRRKQSATALPSGHLVCNVIGFLSRCLSIQLQVADVVTVCPQVHLERRVLPVQVPELFGRHLQKRRRNIRRG